MLKRHAFSLSSARNHVVLQTNSLVSDMSTPCRLYTSLQSHAEHRQRQVLHFFAFLPQKTSAGGLVRFSPLYVEMDRMVNLGNLYKTFLLGDAWLEDVYKRQW